MQANPINFDYSQSALIKSPFEDLKNREVQHRYTRVVVDSRDRDATLFPTPAAYEVQLETDIEEVTSVELLLADVPLVAYNVPQGGNQLLLRLTDGATGAVVAEAPVRVPPGDHTAATLAPALQAALDEAAASVGGGRAFAVAHDALTDRLTVSSADGPFALLPAAELGASCAPRLLKALGVPAAGMASSPDGAGRHVLAPPFRLNLQDNRYVVVNVQQLASNSSANTVLHKSFAVLGRPGAVAYQSAASKMEKRLNPPIARLTKLRISFADYYGAPYDFQNHDHRLELLFVSRKHLLRFT